MPLSMSVFLIHLRHPMLSVHCLLVIRSMKTSRRAYGQRIQENEHASFTPVVMSATGGLVHEATYFYKHLASLLSRKWGDEYSVVMGWLRYSLSFPCFVQLFSASGVPVPLFNTMLRLLHQWI